MNTSEDESILKRFNGRLPTSPSAVLEFEKQAGVRLPEAYTRFLLKRNGGEGFIGSHYVILWRLDELLQMNVANRVEKFAPGLFLFGSNGGGEAFAFDMRHDARPIVSVPLVGMDVNEAINEANDFEEFLNALARS